MRLVNKSFLLALSLVIASPFVTSSAVRAEEGTKAMDAKTALAQEETGKPKLPKKGTLKTIKRENQETHCEKCHEKGEPECKACKDFKKDLKKDAKKADCKDCPDCKEGKKDCKSCDHCQRKGHGDHHHGEKPADAGKDAPKPEAPKAQ